MSEMFDEVLGELTAERMAYISMLRNRCPADNNDVVIIAKKLVDVENKIKYWTSTTDKISPFKKLKLVKK